MRIISGAWRGRTMIAPTGQQTRPTSDRAREGLFSMLTSRLGSFEGLHVADLFAGSGALGLESLSRGAAHCLFVDQDRQAIAAIRRNIEALAAGPRADVRQQSVGFAPSPNRPLDLVFLDPPYDGDLAQQALDHIANPSWLAPGAMISVETATQELTIPPILARDAQRRFGKAWLTLLRFDGQRGDAVP
jgi:16S rRNA (guanine966-N2)-methyltransferase